MSCFDAYAATRNLIDNAVSHLTWHEKACSALGFKGISQIWKEQPAWYFWLDGIKGGVMLRLHKDEAVGSSQYVSLSLHYYPAAGTAAYLQLTAEEKVLIADEQMFDLKTDTPRFETFEECLPYFLVAEIGLLIDEDGQLQLLVFSSQTDSSAPSAVFFDFLVKTLNFYLKKHHHQVRQIDSGPTSSIILIYDDAAFINFEEIYELDIADFVDTLQADVLEHWKLAAHLDAQCSMQGACSCH